MKVEAGRRPCWSTDMSKYSLIAVSAIAWFAIPSKSQTLPETHPFIQRIAAEREAEVRGGAEELHARMQAELISRGVVERRAKLRQDTEKLLALAAELKQHVDK